jgi:AcrR family transcriptional regulator
MHRVEVQDATRDRLVEAAGEVFAERGFRSATVREICSRAGANVAAVNYYFRDKMGLYIAVFQQSMGAPGLDRIPPEVLRNGPPEQLFRTVISGMLHKMYGADSRGAWHLRIMAHEMAQPTEALPRVAEEVIGPRYLVLRQIIARIIGLPADHETTRLCAHSVIGQVVHYAHAQPVIACLWPDFKMTPRRIERIAAHIADFSICSLHRMARRKNKVSDE